MAGIESKAPISRNPDEVVRRILDAAEAEFGEVGYEAASTNRIVDRFAGSKATLFRHFRSKERLLEAVIRRIADRWRGAVDWQSIDGDDPQQWLTNFATRILEWILQPDPLFVGRLGIAEGDKFPTLAGVFDEMAGAPLRSALEQRLRDWTSAGKLSCHNPEGDAGRFFDLVVAGAVSRALYRVEVLRGASLRRHVNECVLLFLEGRGASA